MLGKCGDFLQEMCCHILGGYTLFLSDSDVAFRAWSTVGWSDLLPLLPVVQVVTMSLLLSPGNGYIEGKELENFFQELEAARRGAGVVRNSHQTRHHPSTVTPVLKERRSLESSPVLILKFLFSSVLSILIISVIGKAGYNQYGCHNRRLAFLDSWMANLPWSTSPTAVVTMYWF